MGCFTLQKSLTIIVQYWHLFPLTVLRYTIIARYYTFFISFIFVTLVSHSDIFTRTYIFGMLGIGMYHLRIEDRDVLPTLIYYLRIED